MLVRHIGHLQAVFNTFREYAGFSNLKLNLKKMVLIPLFLPGKLEEAGQRLKGYLPEAELMEITDHAKYLGVMVGPGGVEHFWEAPPPSLR